MIRARSYVLNATQLETFCAQERSPVASILFGRVVVLTISAAILIKHIKKYRIILYITLRVRHTLQHEY
ncbi:uncharacterized protein YALI1_B06885g [Yarrowia lipolytica]|uniref:Uncharacterized protein n=1 Tax=Yarrowia lipolytica TaxID=4952 RepID=A0A1D8N6I7_YARLL|nr:hypothetical protein YALI1_B06885g [Yarrowia lipolytica]